MKTRAPLTVFGKTRIFALMFCLLQPSISHAQGSALTFGALIELGRRSANSVIETAGEEARKTIDHLAGRLSLLIDQAQTAYAESLTLTFEKLDEQQQKLFRDIEALITDIDAAMDKQFENAAELVNRIDALLTRIPFVKGRPYVQRLSPNYITPGPKPESVTITVSGQKLDGWRTLLHVGKRKIKPEGVEYGKMLFVLAPEDIPQRLSDSVWHTSCMLTFEEPHAWGLYYTDIATYNVALFVPPATIGTFQVAYTPLVKETKKVTMFTGRFSSFETRARDETHRMGPEKGWLFDMSVPPKITGVRKKEGYMNNARYQSETVLAVARGADAYDRKFGHNGKKGWVEGDIEVVLYRMVPATEPNKGPSGSIVWGVDQPIQLPAAIQEFSVIVTYFNGRVEVLTGPRKNAQATFLRMEELPRSNQIILKPQKFTDT